MKQNNGNLLWIALVVAAASTLVAGAWASAGGGNGVPDQIAALESRIAALKAQLETQKQAIASGDTALQAQLNDQKKAIQDGDSALQAQLNEQKKAIQDGDTALQAQLDTPRP